MKTIDLNDGPKVAVGAVTVADIRSGVSDQRVTLDADWANHELKIRLRMTAAEARRIGYALLGEALKIEPDGLREHMLALRNLRAQPVAADADSDTVLAVGP